MPRLHLEPEAVGRQRAPVVLDHRRHALDAEFVPGARPVMMVDDIERRARADHDMDAMPLHQLDLLAALMAQGHVHLALYVIQADRHLRRPQLPDRQRDSGALAPGFAGERFSGRRRYGTARR